jgi:hypothetical protein
LVACWRYEPREHLRPLAIARAAIPPSPLRDRSATPITIDFGAMFPFTVVPAYNLPVYASQRPLPDATQDSVRGCLQGFAAAVIADGRLQRACKAQPAQNRTGGFPAYGSHLGCVTAKRSLGQGWRIIGFGSQASTSSVIRSHVIRSFLAATSQRASPEVGHMMPEHIQCLTVGRHCRDN